MPNKKRHIPYRTCIACGKKAPKMDLLRIAIKDDKVVWDIDQTLSGRGAYCCNNDECITYVKNNKKNCINRALRNKFKEIKLNEGQNKKSKK